MTDESTKALRFSLREVIAIVLFIVTTISGVWWFLYTTGRFTPNTTALNEATEYKYAYQKSVEDYSALTASKDALEAAHFRTLSQVAELESGHDLNRAAADIIISRNQMVGDTLSACVNASTSGQSTNSVEVTEQAYSFTEGQGGLTAAAAGIAAYDLPHDGSSTLSKCMAEVEKLLEILAQTEASFIAISQPALTNETASED